MAKISGILTDGAGRIINDCTIELYAKKTTNNVLVQTQAFAVASDGKYSINAQPCEYDVSLIVNGFPKKRLGTINVYSDSVDGTLNDYLINPEASDLTPEFLKQVFDARSEAKNSAIDSEKSAEKSADSANAANASETNAKSSADAAKASADEATICSQSARESAMTATNASESAKSYSDSAKSYADSASSSATASHNSAQQSSNSANAASSSERNAKTSEQNAKKSAEDAKSWASTIDTTSFIKKTGEDNQSINGSLDVKKLTEQGQRVYSPNNKPDADTVGALPATRIVKNDVPTYSVGDHVEFEKTLTVGGKSVITDLTDVDNKIELINTELSDTSNQINTLNDRIYVVESYCDGYSWYRVYSDGFIVQSSTALIGIPNANVVCGTLINLLKPMRTLHYGVSIDKLYSGAWGMNAFSSSELYQSSFWLAAYSTIACDGWIRWTVQGY